MAHKLTYIRESEQAPNNVPDPSTSYRNKFQSTKYLDVWPYLLQSTPLFRLGYVAAARSIQAPAFTSG